MAKGDHKRMQDQLKSQSVIAQGSQNRTSDTLNNSNAIFGDNYDRATGMNMDSYNEIMNGYRSAMGGGGAGGGGTGAGGGIGTSFGWDPLFRGAMRDAIGGYGEFSRTGGFSDQDKQDIRARGVAPMRAVYANAQSELNRSRSLTGGSPNFAAASTRMARQQGQGLSDQMTNINAGLAEMIQQGRLAGLGGLSQTGAAGQGLSTNIDALTLQAQVAKANAARASGSAGAANNMAALHGMQSLYGMTPGMMELTGNQLLGSEHNLLANQQNQNQLSQMILNGQLGSSQVPGNFQSAMGNVGAALAPIGAVAGAFGGGLGGLVPTKNNVKKYNSGGYSS